MGAQSIFMLILTLDFYVSFRCKRVATGFLDFNINKYIYDVIVKCRKIY